MYTVLIVMAFCTGKKKLLASVVQKVDSAIHRINRFPADSAIVCFSNKYPLDSDLSDW